MSGHGRTFEIWDGDPEEAFVMTRSQIQHLALSSGQAAACGLRASYFECVEKGEKNVWSYELARAKWLHIATANHLRKARKTIRELRRTVERLQGICSNDRAVIDGYRGQVGRDNPFAHIPDHYLGDGFVSCDRAIESASAQRCIGERSKLQFWYWATAMKYVWRMWSKEDPEKDSLKAIDCLEKAAGLGRLVSMEGREDG